MCASIPPLFFACCALLWQGAASEYHVLDDRLVAYEDFRDTHRPFDPAGDHVPYEKRMALFELRSKRVRDHNSRGASWQATVNRFADFTDEELRAMLGYRRGLRGSRAEGGASFLEEEGEGRAIGGGSNLRTGRFNTAAKDWRESLPATRTFIRDQGPCGSCWAVAAVGAVEAHLELAGQVARRLSFRHLVNCVPNPRHCGGTGGCAGATGELAMEFMQAYGVAAEDAYSHDLRGACPDAPVSVVAKIASFVRLPENQYLPMWHALAERGPVVASADASLWHNYHSGVFDGCQRDSVTNHAILVVGFGEDATSGLKYWLLRNSWGPHWGHDGHMLLLRHDEESYCGIDRDAHEGVACDGDPDEVKVCGMCGILSDTVYPQVSANGTVWWS